MAEPFGYPPENGRTVRFQSDGLACCVKVADDRCGRKPPYHIGPGSHRIRVVVADVEGPSFCFRRARVELGESFSTRGRTNEWLIGHFKDPPAYVHGSLMPPFKNLTSEQLQALTLFLQTQAKRAQ